MSSRVYVYIVGWLTTPSNERFLSIFKIWLNRIESFPQKGPLEIVKNFTDFAFKNPDFHLITESVLCSK